jgi:glycosyltransferase involved in cell wall biosynthesis
MRIALVSAKYIPAQLTGSENLIKVFAEQLAAAGHDVTVLTSYIEENGGKGLRGEECVNGVHVRRFRMVRLGSLAAMLPRRAKPDVTPKPEARPDGPPTISPVGRWLASFSLIWLSWLLAPGLFAYLLRKRWDVVHVTPFPQTHVWIAARAASLAGVPVVLTPAYHVLVQQPVAWLLPVLGRMITRFAVSTERERLDLVELGMEAARIETMPPGIACPSLAELSGARFRTRYGIGAAPVVLFAGPPSFDKGYHHLVEAMQIVRRTRPDMMLVKIGSSSQAGEGLSGPGFMDAGFLRTEAEKWDAFDACDMLVMPSRCDSFGLVYVEAWLCGKPVIGARCGAIPWVIRDGVDGLLVPFGDTEAIAQAILQLAADAALRQRFGQAGRKQAWEKYAAADVVRRLEGVYRAAMVAPAGADQRPAGG